LKPVTLHTLAEALRDDVLLDMRVLHDERMVTLERVRLDSILVRRYDEAVVARQEFLDGDTRLEHELTIECDCIMWARPTSFELHTVNPVVKPCDETELVDLEGVMDRAWEAAADAFDCVLPVEMFKQDAMDNWKVDILHFVVLLAWHTSDMKPDTICKLVGYRSQQPYLTAHAKYGKPSWRGEDAIEKQRRERRVSVLREAVERVKQLGGRQRTGGPSSAHWLL
jgi:hypothetical protein